MHMNFGLDLINEIRKENPEIWTSAFEKNILEKFHIGVDLETRYAKECLPNGMLGLTHDMMTEYTKYIADRRLAKLGVPLQFKGAKNPFPWMSEVIDLRKEKNFFETRVTEYQTGGTLDWD